MGQLTVTVTNSATAVNLTSVGLVDWSDWATGAGVSPAATDYKSGGGNTVPTPTCNGANTYTNDARTISWTNGTNTGSSSNTAGFYVGGSATGDGFTFPFVADTNVRTVYVYTGGYNLTTAATVTATMSDGSATTYTNNTTMTGAASTAIDTVIELVFQANSAAQTCTLNVALSATVSGSNVSLQAVAFASVTSGGSTATTAWLT